MRRDEEECLAIGSLPPSARDENRLAHARPGDATILVGQAEEAETRNGEAITSTSTMRQRHFD